MSMSDLQISVLDAIEKRLKDKADAQFYAFKNIYPAGQGGSCDLSLSFRFTSLLYFEFTFYCYLHEVNNDIKPSSLGNGWAVSSNDTALDELVAKDEANRAFRKGLEELFLNSSFHETKRIYDEAEDSGQLLKRFMRDGEACSWRKEARIVTPRVTFYALEENSLVTPDCPWLIWQIRTDSTNSEIVGLHLGGAEYLGRKKDLPLEILEAFQKIAAHLSLKFVS